MATLELYKMDTCPFCQKVMKFMDENGIDGVQFHDVIEHPEYRDWLQENGGSNQVPALVIDDKIMYESDDIIDWMKEHLLGGKASDAANSDAEPPVCPID